MNQVNLMPVINILPDDVLLEIFDFYVIVRVHLREEIEAWQSLVHVCQRWRRLAFGSPRRLDMRLLCATKTQTRIRDTLDIWPALPLIIEGSANPEESDSIVAVLERSDRVYEIYLDFSSSHFEVVWTALQRPFPKLTTLYIFSPLAGIVVPDSILGGSASHLKELWLNGIPFPGLPKLLLTATNLVHLQLTDIPHPPYFSLDAILTILPTLTSLSLFWLQFRSPQSRPDWASRHPPPMKRSVISSLSSLRFTGPSECLEDLVTRIDTPRLMALYITLFNQIVFDTPHTIQFISRTLALKALEEARLTFDSGGADLRLSSRTSGFEQILVRVRCRSFDWQVSSMEQVSTLSLPHLSVLEDLYIYEQTYSAPDWKDNIENTLWLEKLRPFATVKNLYLSDEFASRIAPALQELVGDRTTEVLPALQNLFLEGLQPSGPVQEGIVTFVSARQLSGHPINVSLWEGAAERQWRGMLS